MKKTIRFFAIVAAFAAMAACNKEQDIVEVPVIIEENAPEAASYDPAEYLTGFGAAMEETKADLAESGAFSWTNGDQVKVIRSDGQEALYAYNESESKFAPEGEPLEKNGEPMHAFFPAGNFVWDTDHVQFTMPAAFESLTGIMNPMAAVIPADATAETCITLKNLGGIYEVRLSTSNALGETVTKVQLGNSGVNITGTGRRQQLCHTGIRFSGPAHFYSQERLFLPAGYRHGWLHGHDCQGGLRKNAGFRHVRAV